MKTILVLSFSPITIDPRVMRQVHLLGGSYQLVVAGYGDSPPGSGSFVRLEKSPVSLARKALWALKLLAGLHESYYWGLPQIQHAKKLLQAERFDLVIANDLPALPVALRLAGNIPVLFDAHEYSPREYENSVLWRLLFQRYNQSMCLRYLPKAAGMSTVCQGIANEYAAKFGVRPFVVHNAPVLQPLVPSRVDEGHIRLVHHGVASRARQLESMIDMMAFLDERFTLDFMLMESEPGYMKFLVQRAKADRRIRFISPVAMPDICRTINVYDVGVFLLRPDNFNYQHALPNKFFEFVQGRLAVAIGPSPEMKALVERHRCGVVAASFEPRDLARALQSLNADDVRRLKAAAHAAAPELSFERDGRRLLAAIDSLLVAR
ncbi:MAG: glycosyltransferase [Alcaligenaceae bacterium]|nr:glycosyltransferase [Alcaligenaceae bacterium]